MSDVVFSPEQGRLLLRTARDSIGNGLRHGRPLRVEVETFELALRQRAACFVTLTIDGHLRGCIGRIEAEQPLIKDVAENAYAAAFSDPRFAPLQASEQPLLKMEISILSAPEPMACEDEASLLAQIRPGVDGLILRDGARRGTFLPSVWAQLPNAREFLRELKQKAGLPPGYWSERLELLRYTTTCIKDS